MISDSIARWAWRGQQIDPLVLAPPRHDGGTPAVAREVYHRLSARLSCIEIYHRQWTTMWFAFVMAAAALKVSSMSLLFLSTTEFILIPYYVISGEVIIIIGLAITLGIFLLGILALPLVMGGCVTREICDEAEGVCRRTFVRDIPDGTPEDLQDVWRQGWITADGDPISSEICESDARSMAARERALWWIPSLAALALAVCTLFYRLMSGNPIAAYFNGVANGERGNFLLILVLVAIKAVLDKHPGKQRAQELNAQAGVEGVAFAQAGGLAWSSRFERARERQIKEAIRESDSVRPNVVLGTSTGLLAARGDFFAPSAALPFSAGLRDLETHLLILGGTGSGKTSGVIRPIAVQVGGWKDTGMVVLDGKAALPMELSSIPGMRVIDPERESVSLVGGLDPVTAIDTIVDLFNKGSEKADRFYTDNAAILLRQSAVLANAAGGSWWTLSQIAEVAFDDSARESVLQAISEELIDTSRALADAILFLKKAWPDIDERVRSSIVATARSWISTITAAPDLLKWAETEEKDETVVITSVLQGGRIGILVPSHRYGRAGAVVTALLKARIYSGIKARADRGMLPGETPVVFIIDEVQEVATEDDATMLAIGRSLRLSFIGATQSVEGVIEKLGEQVAQKWLAIFGGVIALPGRSNQTDTFVSMRAGMSWRPSIDQINGMSVRTAIQAEMVSGALAAGRTQPTALQFSDVPKVGSPGVPKWVQNLARTWQQFGPTSAQGSGAGGTPGSSLGIRPIAEAGEISALLAEPDTALAVMTRARVVRRDIIRLNPIFK